MALHVTVYAALLTLVTVAPQIVRAQRSATRLPRLEDYPVTESYSGTPHAPIIVTPQQRMFRTRIRQGVEKGWGVWINGEWGKEQDKPGPNFAGHYIVIVWGCGTGCIRMAMSDADTGAVFDPPLSADGNLALPILVSSTSVGRAAEMEYRKDSRLFIIRATPHWTEPNAVPYEFYYLWQNNRWKLLRRVAIDR